MPYEKETIAKKMKANPIANEKRLRVQREKKQKYRQSQRKYGCCYCRKFCDRARR